MRERWRENGWYESLMLWRALCFLIYWFHHTKSSLYTFWCSLICYLFRYYINYKLMKKKVKQYAHQIESGSLDRRHVLKDFSRMLDNQVCFYLYVVADFCGMWLFFVQLSMVLIFFFWIWYLTSPWWLLLTSDFFFFNSFHKSFGFSFRYLCGSSNP